jgi:hypothetical protein
MVVFRLIVGDVPCFDDAISATQPSPGAASSPPAPRLGSEALASLSGLPTGQSSGQIKWREWESGLGHYCIGCRGRRTGARLADGVPYWNDVEGDFPQSERRTERRCRAYFLRHLEESHLPFSSGLACREAVPPLSQFLPPLARARVHSLCFVKVPNLGQNNDGEKAWSLLSSSHRLTIRSCYI